MPNPLRLPFTAPAGSADEAGLLPYLPITLTFVTDSWYQTLAATQAQAEFEYAGVSSTWQTPEGENDGT